MMISMQEVGIEGPRMRIPGQKPDMPFYQHTTTEPKGTYTESTNSGPGPSSGSLEGGNTSVAAPVSESNFRHGPSHTARNRGESISEMSKRVDFSLGMKDVSSGDMMGELFENSYARLPEFTTKSPSLRSRTRHQKIPEIDEGNARHDDPLYPATSQSTESRARYGSRRTYSESPSRPRSTHSVIHSNRFFSSRRHKRDHSGSEYDDLMEQGMADIPESVTPKRLDPRSGIVSPQAVEMSVPGQRFSDELASPRTFVVETVEQQKADEGFELKDLS